MKVWERFCDGVVYRFCGGKMQIRYRFSNGEIKTVEVNSELEEAYKGLIRLEMRGNAKERYYRHEFSLDSMDESDEELGSDLANPEVVFLGSCEKQEQLKREREFFRSLAARQMEVVRLLKQGKSSVEVAENLGITKQSVYDIKKSVQKKFKEFF
jgi:DNA-binding NarL/FixJ family response regulator